MADDFDPRRATRSFWQRLKQLKEIIDVHPGLINDRAAWYEYCRQHQVPPDLYRLVDFLPLLEAPLKEKAPPEEEEPEQPHRRTYWGHPEDDKAAMEDYNALQLGGEFDLNDPKQKERYLKAIRYGEKIEKEQKIKRELWEKEKNKQLAAAEKAAQIKPSVPTQTRGALTTEVQKAKFSEDIRRGPSISFPQRRYPTSFRPTLRQGGPISRGLNLLRPKGMGGMGGLGGRAGGGIGNAVNAARSAAKMMMNLGRLAGMLGTPAGLPLMAILVVVGLFIVVFLIIMSQGGIGFGGGVGNVGIAPPAVSDITNCIFTRASQSSKIKSATLAAWISQAATKGNIPPAIVAGVAMVENPDFFMNAGDNHDGIKNNYYYYVEATGTTRAIGLMQIAIGRTTTNKGVVDHCSSIVDGGILQKAADYSGKKVKGGSDYYCVADVNERVKRFCQTDSLALNRSIYTPPDNVADDTYINLCKITDNIAVGVAELNSKIGTGAWTNEADVKKAINGYYGACVYPGGNYCDEVWQGYQNCKVASSIVSIKPGDYCGAGINQPSPPSLSRIIVLNPGHAVNPVDPELNGAAGEAEKNVALAKKIKERLDNKGYQVFLTHDEKSTPDPTNRYNDYQQRIDFSNRTNADLFIEIHFNAGAGGPSTFYSDRRILSDDGVNTRPNPNVVTQNVDQWIANSQKINQLIGTKIASKTSSSAENNIPDHRCMGRACGGHLFTIGPQGTLSDPSRPESIINRENKAVGAYVETLGINNPNANSLDLLADAYVEGVNEYFGLTSSSLAQNLPKTAGSIPSTNLAEAIQQQFGIKMVGFTDQELKWAWEKLSDISGSSFLRLTNASPGDPITIDKTFNNCQQYHCKFIGFCQLSGEINFKIVLLHELGHIVHWCSGDRAKRTESYNFYATHAITAYGATDQTENYPEMLTYYLNPGATEQTALGYARPITPYSQPINNDYYQLSNKIMCNN